MRPTFEKVSRPTTASFRCYVRDDPFFEFNWHFHPEYELTCILESRGRRFVGDDIADYRTGDLVLLGSNLPHTWYSGKPRKGARHRAVVVQFDRDGLGSGLFDLPEMRGISRLLDRASRGLQFIRASRSDIASRLLNLSNARAGQRIVILLDILDRLSRATDAAPLASAGYQPAGLSRSGQHRFDDVCTFLNERYAQEIIPSAVARIAGLSPSAFCRFFKSTTGKTLTQYVNDLRTGHACRLLVETDLPITEICFQSGFANVSNFNRRFLEMTGATPREYRQQFISPNE